jgi:hypothetical protein
MRFSKSILLTATALLVPYFSQAASVTSNPTLSVAGLTFNDFTCSLSNGGLLADPSSCQQINVNTITQPGSGIQISSGFVAALGSFDDAVLTYNVSSTSGIGVVGLDFNGTFEGLAVSQVTESVYSGNELVGFAKVSCDALACDRTDNIVLNQDYANLHIEKDILVAAALGDATISIVDQTFSPAPEPASIAMLGGGLLAAAGFLRRRKGAVKA